MRAHGRGSDWLPSGSAHPSSTERTAGAIPYGFKRTVHSSHAAVLDVLPREGHGRKVLDLGCSNGYLGAELALRGYQVVGVEKAGGYGQAFPKELRLVEHDLELGVPESAGDCYDYVVCADILEHLRHPGELLSTIPKILKADGKLIASLPNSGHAYFRWSVLRGRFPQEDRGLFDRTHLRFYMWDGWVRLFAEAGFEIQVARPTSVPVGIAFPVLPPVLVHSLEALSVGLARIWKTLFAYQFVVVAVRSNRSQ